MSVACRGSGFKTQHKAHVFQLREFLNPGQLNWDYPKELKTIREIGKNHARKRTDRHLLQMVKFSWLCRHARKKGQEVGSRSERSEIRVFGEISGITRQAEKAG